LEIRSPVRAADRKAWRRWLERNAHQATEAWLILAKKGSRTTGVRYAEALEEALCFGWIDSTSKAIDGDSYAQRFSPRRPGSHWSEGNEAAARRLIREGLMSEPGLKAFRGARSSGRPGFRK
jgi:uncharacterized protein YdeI (YjbR/CyaY-like superfamily)